MQRIAIMQGRLLPPIGNRIQCFPREHWQAEFELAARAGLDAIEWIYDDFGKDVNPIGTDDGIAEMKRLSHKHGIAVASVCADYFMDWPLVTASASDRLKRLHHLLWLLERCHRLGIERVVLPFVDSSSIEAPQQQAEAVSLLLEAAPVASQHGIELHLETSLAPEAFATLLKELPDSTIKANYDAGNSASLGYDYRKELAAYGKRIGSVHIKDRVRGGGTVPLGQGNADIPGLLKSLDELGYTGDFVLQVSRGEAGDEVEWTRHNRAFLLHHLHELGRGASR